MSLINEALKKAQRMRSPPTSDAAAQPLPGLIRRRPAQARTVALAATGAAGVVAILAVGIAWALWPATPDPTPASPAEPVVEAAPEPSLSAEPLPPEPVASPQPPPIELAAMPPSPEPPPPPPPPEPDPRVYVFLDQARITGVRVSATDPKVLLNDRLFRLNDVVDRSLNLRITGIDGNALTFTDESGYVYTKEF